MIHVDLIKNEWHSGQQRRIGCVYEVEGKLTVYPPELHDLLAIKEADSLKNMVKLFQGDYMFASLPHTEDQCWFNSSETIKAKQTPLSEGEGG